jgi:hypothetical protein
MRVFGVGGIRALWRELAPEHRRWIYLNALLATALINLVVNAGIALLSLNGEHRVPLWSVPLIDRPSSVTDTLGTLFLLPLVTCLLCTSAVWHDIATGKLPPLRRSKIVQALAAQVPAARLRRGLAFGALCLVALAPLSIVLLVAIDFANLTGAQFVVYKAALGLALGALVTPVIAILAMTDHPATAIADPSTVRTAVSPTD